MSEYLEKITTQEMAYGMYSLFIKDTVKEALRDHDENIILDKDEQALLFLAHLCDLLTIRNLNAVKAELIYVFTRDQRRPKDEEDYLIEILSTTKSVEKISRFFKILPPEPIDFVKKDWIFNKKLDTIQMVLMLSWYTQRLKAIDKTFNEIIDKAIIY